jgi:hypothetical protein
MFLRIKDLLLVILILLLSYLAYKVFILEVQLENFKNLNISLEKKLIFLEMEKTSLEKINDRMEAHIEAYIEGNDIQETSFFTIQKVALFIGLSLMIGSIGGLFKLFHLQNNTVILQGVASQTKTNTASVIGDVIKAVEAIKVVEVVKVVEIVKANEDIINSMYI